MTKHASLAEKAISNPPHILIITGDAIQKQMAGPAIRVWHMAEAISKVAEVRVISWAPIDRTSEKFELHFVGAMENELAAKHEEWADVIIVQGFSLRFYPSIRKTKKIIVADIYDPIQLEQLEQNKFHPRAEWRDEVTKAVSLINEQLARADFFICASEYQKSLWLGNLSALGRLNPDNYQMGSSFKKLIDIVPFGLEDKSPVQTRHAIKGTIPGISPTDRVMIWGGGIYNWFDTLTLIEAMALLKDSHPEIKLFFLSAKHFNPDVPEMKMATDTMALTDELGLTDKTVFFNNNWVEYDDRVNFLMDADLGISTHFIHAETRFSFRTRMLDYLWASLPIVATEGDIFADLIAKKELGITVTEKSPETLASAITSLLYDDSQLAKAQKNVLEARTDFFWSKTLEPLVDFCANPYHSADNGMVETEKLLSHFALSPFEEILFMPRGIRRDFKLFTYYLRNHGPIILFGKIDDRLRRVLGFKPKKTKNA